MTDMRRPQPVNDTDHGEIHLQDYLKVLFGHWRLVIAVFLLVAGGVAGYTLLQAPVFEASATLYLRDGKGKDVLLGELSGLSSSSIPAELEILKSRSLSEKVVRRLHLNIQPSDPVTVRIGSFDKQDNRPLFIESAGGAHFRIFLGSDLVGEGVTGELFSSAKITILLEKLEAKSGDRVRLDVLDAVQVADGLRQRIRAQEVGNRTGIIRVAIADTDPERARAIIEALCAAYLDQSVSYKTEEARNTLEFIDQQLETVRDALNRAEKSVEEYQTEHGIAGLSLGGEAILTKVVETETILAALELRIDQIGYALEVLDRGVGENMALPAIDDPAITPLLDQIVQLEAERVRMSSEYIDNSLPLETLQHGLFILRQNLRSTLENARQKIDNEKNSLQKLLARYESELRKLPASERELARLTRLSEVNAGIYTYLLEKREEARIIRASTTSNISVIDPAVTPRYPIKPNKKKNILLGLIFGALLGVGLAFFIDYFQDVIKDGEMASRLLGWPVLAVIPHIGAGNKHRNGEDRSLRTRTLITSIDPKSPPAEAFRSLRTALHFVQHTSGNRVLLVTSSVPGEGKTTIAANLAETLAQAGRRVLLIGCDLRRPTLHTVFGSPLSPGLSEYLSDQVTFDSILLESGIANLHFISSGATPPNPAELLGGSRMIEMVARMRSGYDTIMIDAPPMLAVTDAAVLSSCCDAALIVVEAAGVSRKSAIKMRGIVEQAGIRVTGIVMNDKTGKGWAYYSGYYGSYGGYSYATEQKRPAWIIRLLRSLTGFGRR